MLDICGAEILSIGYKDGIGYSDAIVDSNLASSSKFDEHPEPDELEYIWILLRQGFSYITSQVSFLPYPEHENAYWDLFSIYRFRAENMDNPCERYAWTMLQNDIRKDFFARKDSILRGKDKETFARIIQDNIDCFEYEDRERIDIVKLSYLILFVYDFCIFTMREAILHPQIASYIREDINIGGTTWTTSRAICSAVKKYLKQGPFQTLESVSPSGNILTQVVEKTELPLWVGIDAVCQNAKANDSNVSAMFVDLMHRFFKAFGLKKRKEWGKKEKELLYELLRYFGLCGSSTPASSTSYITTIAHDSIPTYFSKCKLHSWIRASDQPYSYLMSCGREPLFGVMDKDDSYITHPEPEGVTPVSTNESINEVQQLRLRPTNSENRLIRFYITYQEPESNTDFIPIPDDMLYVKKLIEDNFLYIAFVPVTPQALVVRKNLMNPQNWNNVFNEVCYRINQEEAILRNHIDKEAVLGIIVNFRKKYSDVVERNSIDVDKLYKLFLFIYDYVMFTYKEAALRLEIKRHILSTIEVSGEVLPSTVLIDDMIRTYIANPFTFKELNGKYYRFLRNHILYHPSSTPIIMHPNCSIVNTTAMFYDLFARFFSSFGLSKRKGASISELEKDFIAKLAQKAGICNSDRGTTVSSIYLKNKDYFRKSQLALSIRENEYWHLMLNNQEGELFTPNELSEQNELVIQGLYCGPERIQ